MWENIVEKCYLFYHIISYHVLLFNIISQTVILCYIFLLNEENVDCIELDNNIISSVWFIIYMYVYLSILPDLWTANSKSPRQKILIFPKKTTLKYCKSIIELNISLYALPLSNKLSWTNIYQIHSIRGLTKELCHNKLYTSYHI